MSSIQSSTTIPSPRAISAWLPSAMLAAGILLAIPAIGATQASPQAQAPATATAKKSPRHRTPATAVQPEPPAPEPPQPEPPKWPVNDAPSKPSVTWDSSGLKIDANNSSLHDILKEVSADTGAKVEGLGADERVFGAYGPGTARDVLSQLLHGSSYNVLMIGDQGAGTPRQIVLSARRTGNNPQPANAPAAGPEDQEPEEDIPDQPEDNDQSGQPPIINNGNPPMPMPPQGPPGVPGAPRTPQQVLQELQQRQQQIQDQQQQQEQQQPH